MSPVLQLAPRLAVQRLRGARAGSTLDVLAVLSFAVSGFLTLTVAGGTWMFFSRWQQPSGPVRAAMGTNGPEAGSLLETYVALACVACALLVLPVLTLGAGAARLGARGRARRLASLRLIGMSGGEVVTVSLVETAVHALVGTLIGLLGWLISLPAWGAVTFQTEPLSPRELLMPWPLILLIGVTLILLGAASALLGLQRVRISPLGVAMQQTPRGLRFWRFGLFLATLLGAVVFGQVFDFGRDDANLQTFAMVAVVILLVVGAINLVGPWALQVLARILARTGSPPRLIAARRIVEDPRGAWRNVAGVALLGLISAYVSILPTGSEFTGDDSGSTLITDLRTGVVITLAVGLLVAATSTLVSQAALVVDQADQSVAMDRAGFPRGLLARIRRQQVLAPLTVTLSVSIGLGLLLAVPFMAGFPLEFSGVALILLTVTLGFLLTLGAAEACRPLQRRILDQPQRSRD